MGAKNKLTFKDVFTPPFDDYGMDGTMVFDSQDRISFMSFLSGNNHSRLMKKLNGEMDGKLKSPDFSIDLNEPGKILFQDVPVLLVRGWGRLTGPGGLNLSPGLAAKLQDDFAKWIVETLNN